MESESKIVTFETFVDALAVAKKYDEAYVRLRVFGDDERMWQKHTVQTADGRCLLADGTFEALK